MNLNRRCLSSYGYEWRDRGRDKRVFSGKHDLRKKKNPMRCLKGLGPVGMVVAGLLIGTGRGIPDVRHEAGGGRRSELRRSLRPGLEPSGTSGASWSGRRRGISRNRVHGRGRGARGAGIRAGRGPRVRPVMPGAVPALLSQGAKTGLVSSRPGCPETGRGRRFICRAAPVHNALTKVGPYGLGYGNFGKSSPLDAWMHGRQGGEAARRMRTFRICG